MRSSLRIIAALFLTAALAGCDGEGRTRPPQTDLRILNVSPSHTGLTFFREERIQTANSAPLLFGTGQGFRFDSDTYDFSVRVRREPWETSFTTVAEIRESINDQNEYTIVATEANGTAELLFIEQPATDATTLTVVHAADGQPVVDTYFVPPNTDPASGTPLGTIGFRENLYTEAISAGDWQFVVTEAGNAAVVLFRSNTFTIEEGASLLIAIADEKNLGTAPFGVYAADNAAQRLFDMNQPAALRVINGASDGLARDVYVDGDFTAPFVAAPYGTVGTYQPISAGAPEFTITPAGNPGVEEATYTTSVGPARRYTMIIGGNPTDGVVVTTIIQDHRRIDGTAGLQFINTAHAFDFLAFYILPPGTSTDGQQPVIGLIADVGTASVSFEPDDYELTVVDTTTSTVVAGPIPLALSPGSIQGILITDAAGGSTVDVTVFDDSAP